MHNIFPKRIQLKNGELLMIRDAVKKDASALIRHVNKVGGETDFLTRGAGEFKMSRQEEEKIIQQYAKAKNRIFLIAELDGELVGLLNVNASDRPRMEHIGELGVTVRKAHWGKGIAAHLMQSTVDWAKKTNIIRKLSLTVQVNNTRAIALYKKFGFKKEGKLRRDFRIRNKFYDAFVMGLLID